MRALRRYALSPTLPARLAQAGTELGFLAAAVGIVVGWGLLG